MAQNKFHFDLSYYMEDFIHLCLLATVDSKERILNNLYFIQSPILPFLSKGNQQCSKQYLYFTTIVNLRLDQRIIGRQSNQGPVGAGGVLRTRPMDNGSTKGTSFND